MQFAYYLTKSLLFHVKRKLRATKIAINEKLSLSHRFIALFFLHFFMCDDICESSA